MSTNCSLAPDGCGSLVCTNPGCGKRIKTDRPPDHVAMRCLAFPSKASRPRTTNPASLPNPLPLGDYTEKLLWTIGITEERVAAVVEKFGVAPTCGGCKARKKWLNKVGAWLAGLAR